MSSSFTQTTTTVFTSVCNLAAALQHKTVKTFCLLLLFLSGFALMGVGQVTLDNFTDNDYTLNPTWTLINGAVTQGSGILSTNSSSAVRMSTPFTIAANEWTFDTRVSSNFATGLFQYFFLLKDNQDPSNAASDGYYVEWAGTNGDFKLFKLTNGTSSQLGSTWDGPTTSATVTNFRTIRITRDVSNNFTVSVGGISVITATDASFANSSVQHQAIRVLSPSAHTYSIDNITYKVPLTTPTLTADNTSNNVDNNIDISFTDDASWRAAITAVKIGGTALTVTTDYVVSAGNIQLKPSGGNPLLRTSGSQSVTVEATGYTTATVTQQIDVGAANKLAVLTQPAAPSVNGGALATQPVVQIQDQYGNLTASTASVSAAVGSGTWTLGGTTSVSAVNGTATFSGLTACSAAAVTGATITFSATSLSGATSSTFNISVPSTPTISTPSSGSVTSTSATLGGDITAVRACSISERGIFYSITNGFANGAGTKVSETGSFSSGNFTINVTGLTQGTVYYYKAFATNSAGTSYTTQGTFTTTAASAPTLTAATGATVDAAFDVTFADNATWRSAITGVTIGGTTLTAGYTVTAGKITFTPSASNPANLLQSSGSKSIVITATGYANATVSQTIGAGAANRLSVSTQPAAPTANQVSFATQPVVQIQDQYENLTSSTASVSAAVGSGTWSLGGTTSVSAVSGVATFTNLSACASTSVTGANISFSSSGLTGATTNNINLAINSPAITTHPSATSVCAGNGVATFTVVATGAGLTYQWQVNTGSGWGNVTNGGEYSGATDASLVITNASVAFNGYQYRCVVSGTCSPSVTTNAAALTASSADCGNLDDYRSAGSGNWNQVATWQRHNGTTWVDATATPTSSNGVITIRKDHTVTVTANVTVDQVVVAVGGQITCNANLQLANGTGDELAVFGTFLQTGQISRTTTSYVPDVTIKKGGIYIHNRNFTWGIFDVGSGVFAGVWDNGSTCRITSNPGTSFHSSFVRDFFNLELAWSTGTTPIVIGANAPSQVRGTLKVEATGATGGSVVVGNGVTGRSMTVNNFEMTGGEFYVAGVSASTGTHSLTINGNFTQTGGIFEVCRSDNDGTYSATISGTAAFSGGTTRIMNNSGTGGRIASLTIGGNMTINGGTLDLSATGSANEGRLFLRGDLTLSSGTLGFTQGITTGSSGVYFDRNGGAQNFVWSGGNLSTASGGAGRRFNYRTSSGPADLNEEYRASTAQVTVSGSEGSPVTNYAVWPTSGTVIKNLTIDNAAGVTLSTSKVVNTTLSLSNGILSTGANALTIGASGSISGESSSRYVSGRLGWVFPSTGTNVARNFPIGKGGNYLPVTFTYATAPGSRTVIIEQFEAAFPMSVPGTVSVVRFGNRYWNITQSSIGVNYTVSLNNSGITPVGTAVMIRNEGAEAASSAAVSFSSPNYTNSTEFSTGNVSANVALGETSIPVTITGAAASNKVYDKTNTATITGTLNGIQAGDDVSLSTGTFATVNVGTGISVTNVTLTGTNAGAYTILPQPTGLTANITARPLTITGASNSKTYDGGTSSATVPTITSGALQGSDVAAFTQTYDNKNVGTSKVMTPSGVVTDGNSGNNYSYTFVTSSNGAITAKGLTASLTGTVSKTYDGSTTATLTTSNYNLSGVVGSENVTVTNTTGAYDNKNVGTSKTVTVTSLVLGGADKDNYSISGNATGTVGTITARALTITGASNSKTYDGGISSATVPAITSGALQGSDVASFTQTYDNKNVGTSKVMTPSGVVTDGNSGNNYSYTFVTSSNGTITAKGLTASLTGTVSKIYDGTTTATLTIANYNITGVESGDVVTVTNTSGTYDDKNVGTDKTVTVSSPLLLGGAAAGNYTISGSATGTVGAITAKGLTASLTGTVTKTYDANATATLTSANYSLTGVVGSEDVTVTNTSGTYDNKNVGTGKTVTVASLNLGGADEANYSISGTATGTIGVITKKELTITANNQNVLFGTAVATVTGAGSYTATGFAGGETSSVITGTATYTTNYTNTTAVGTPGVTITPVVSGLSATNYSFTPANGTITISAASKTWVGQGLDKTGNWSVADNWSPSGVPNSSLHSIVINEGTPTMDVNYTVVSGKNLTISGTGALVIGAGRTLTIAGVADFGNRPVTLKSTSVGTSSIGQITGTLSNATAVTVERYMTARRKWRALTAPLTASNNIGSIYMNWQNGGSTATPNTGAIIWRPGSDSAATGLYNGGASSSMLSLSSNNTWIQVTNTKANESLFDGTQNKAYMLFYTGPYNQDGTFIGSGTAASTLSATGTLRTGPVSFDNLVGNWNMIGNPYASAIRTDLLTRGGNLNTNGYIWNPGGSGTGVFTPITLTSATIIQSGQAFFVYSNSGTIGNTLGFSESAKVSSSSNSNFRLAEDLMDGDLKIELNKYVAGNTELSDVAIVNYKSRAEAGLPKLAQFFENMSIYQDNLDYGLTTRTLNDGEDNIQLRMWQMNKANYQIKIDLSGMRLPAGSTAILQDAFLNKETPLSINDVNKVDFSVDANAASSGKRFSIALRRANAPVSITETPRFQIYPNPVVKGTPMQLEFRNKAAGKYTVTLFTIAGVRVQQDIIGHAGGTATQSLKLSNSLASGTYIAEISSVNGASEKVKVVVE